MRAIFMGKHKRSVVGALERAAAGLEVVAVVAPEPTGEEHESQRVDSAARRLGLRLATDDQLYAEIEDGSLSEIDLVLSFLFWKRIHPPLIELPRLGCLNFHPAPLPDIRGLGGYNIAVLEDFPEWGVSAHFVDEEFDTGDLIRVDRFPIDREGETALSLDIRSQDHLLALFRDVIDMALAGEPLPAASPRARAATWAPTSTTPCDACSPMTRRSSPSGGSGRSGIRRTTARRSRSEGVPSLSWTVRCSHRRPWPTEKRGCCRERLRLLRRREPRGRPFLHVMRQRAAACMPVLWGARSRRGPLLHVVRLERSTAARRRARRLRRPAASPPEERRQVTVLFADLSGYTAVAERMDPEAVKSLVDRALRRLGEEVQRYDGTVDKYIGDNVMALFGAPVAHEDDAERAVRAALAMQAAMDEINDWSSLDVPFALRVGINTGEVLAGAVGGDYTVTGDTVNVASRLQSVGRPGAVTVGERTMRATQQAIRYDQLEPLDLKGKAEPVPAWEAVGLVAAQAVGRETVEESQMVGRDDELGVLESVFNRISRDGKPHLVTVIGEAGVGKSPHPARVRSPARGPRCHASDGALPALRHRHRLLGAGRGAARRGRDRRLRQLGRGLGEALPLRDQRAARTSRRSATRGRSPARWASTYRPSTSRWTRADPSGCARPSSPRCDP